MITFSYGGRYSQIGDDIKWQVKKGRSHTLYDIGGEGFGYQVLVGRILHKVKGDLSAILRLSHFAYGLTPKEVIYINDDEDAKGFLIMCERGFRVLLHVEVVKGVVEDTDSRAFANVDEFVSDGIGTKTVVAENDPLLHSGEQVQSEAPWQFEELEQFESSRQFKELEQFEVPRQFDAPEHYETFGLVPYPPSDVDEPECADVTDQVGVIELEWDDGTDMVIGQEFESKRAVQDVIERAMHQHCFDVKTVNSNSKLLVLKCRSNGCKWSIRAARMKGLERFSIRTYIKMHTCSRVTTSTSRLRKKGTRRLVASLIHEDYPGKFDTPKPNQLISLVQSRLGVKVCYQTARRGKKLASNDVRGCDEESFRLLPSYLHMLEVMNPGSVTRIECDEKERFKYMFFALKASFVGFLSMRKVIIIDGTFLKHKYGGVLLIATAQDPDHHHYPIAFGVVDGEKDDSWKWFLEMLKTVVPDNPGLVIVSDRNQSIIKMVGEVFPNAKHGYCIWHLSQNVKSHVSCVNKETVAQKFRECAQVYTEAEFFERYSVLKATYPKAAEYLERSVGENKWARCFFPGERYNIDTTNCAESLNSVFREARKYALLPMFDMIIRKMAEWFNKYRTMARETSREHRLVPYVANVLHKRCETASLMEVLELNGQNLEYYVAGRDGKMYFVDLLARTCSCKHFDIDRYPCQHAIRAVMFRAETRDVDLHEYCSPYYFVEQWESAYYLTIYPIPHSSEWKNIPQDIAARRVLPPKIPLNKGRHQENRFRSSGEGGRRSRRGKGV